MSDVFGKLTDILVFCVVGFILPAFLTAFLMDEVKDTTANITVRRFAEDVAAKGYLDKARYEAFLLGLNASGVVTETELCAEHELLAPEYKMRSVEDMEAYLESLWSGSNVLNQPPMSTQRPSVTDPGSGIPSGISGNVNGTDTSTSGPNPEHTHGDSCHAGEKHSHTEACSTTLVTCAAGCSLHVHTGSSSSGTGCYTKYVAGSKVFCGYTTSPEFSYSELIDCYACYNDEPTMTESHYEVTCKECGDSWLSLRKVECSACGYSNSYGSEYSQYHYVGESSGYYEVDCGKDLTKYYDTAGNVCETCNGTGKVEQINCTLEAGKYYDANGNEAIPSCNKIVASLTPLYLEQIVNAGVSPDVRVKAVFADGHSEVVTAGMTGFNAGSYNTVQTVTLSYGEYAGSLDNAQAFTCTAKRLVRYPTKTCTNGHLYYLASGNSTPCPYCAAYPKTITVQGVEEIPLRIRRGSTLRDNGVFLKVTYYDGRTEIVRSGFTDTLDKNYVGEQTVTIGYGGATTTLLAYTGRIKVNCSVCGYEYQLYPDDTDPGCPKCLAAVPEFTGNVLRYKETVSYGEILDELYYGDGICYFSRGDRFEIELWKSPDNMSGIALGGIFHADMPKELVAMYGVEVRDEEPEKK